MLHRLSRSRLSLLPLLACGAALSSCSGDVGSSDSSDGSMLGAGGANAAGGTGGQESGGNSGGTAAVGGGSASGGAAPGSGGSINEGSGGAGAGAGGETSTGGGAGNQEVSLRIMSLNVWGHMTMPQEAPAYAALIESHEVDVVGIQEGANDWQLSTDWPTDYSRADALGQALGDCWEQRYQIFINTCRGVSFVSSDRFDLTDGPNATRTGELALLDKDGETFLFIDVHWDHEDALVRQNNATETAAASNGHLEHPAFVVGDFNAGCSSSAPLEMATLGSLSLAGDAGIDCIFVRDATGTATAVDGGPSDHPAVVGEFAF